MAQVIVEICGPEQQQPKAVFASGSQGIQVEGGELVSVREVLQGLFPDSCSHDIFLRPGDTLTIRHVLPEAKPQ